jgi:hypothetical protein
MLHIARIKLCAGHVALRERHPTSSRGLLLAQYGQKNKAVVYIFSEACIVFIFQQHINEFGIAG